MADNPATGIELPRHIRKEKRAFTEEEKKMLKACAKVLKKQAKNSDANMFADKDVTTIRGTKRQLNDRRSS